ncbi:hypothetical protein [Micromonospora globispora]|uniref:hypothetical protein n=1 Tax=Micromonospora globispora TaxID=1450148 RepID=UPI000F50E4F2|nr:hypothetical protein [Micromonospora globispora]
MRTEPIHINGLAGPVVVATQTLGAAKIMVGEQNATRTRRNRYLLPAADGTLVDATLSSGLFDPWPSIDIAGVKHRTGPRIPVLLQILIALPFLLVLAGGGLIGGLIGGTAMVINIAIARGRQSTPVKALLMLCVLGAFLLVLGIIGALLQ